MAIIPSPSRTSLGFAAPPIDLREKLSCQGNIGFYDYNPPGFCYKCGTEFPWTERKKIAAIELFIEETQDQDEQREFRESVEQIVRDTPQAQVAGRRINRLLEKVGKSTASVIRDLLVDVVGEAVKKLIVPGS